MITLAKNESYQIVAETCPKVDSAFAELLRDITWQVENITADELHRDIKWALREIQGSLDKCCNSVKECTEALREAHVKAVDECNTLKDKIFDAKEALND